MENKQAILNIKSRIEAIQKEFGTTVKFIHSNTGISHDYILKVNNDKVYKDRMNRETYEILDKFLISKGF